MEQFGKAVWRSFFGVAAIFLTGRGVDFLETRNIEAPIAWLIVVLLAIVIVAVVEYQKGHARNFWLIRALFHYPQRFEDYWIENVQIPGRPFSFAQIYYSVRHQAWVYAGVAFDEDLRPAASWSTRSVIYDDKTFKWTFRGTCRLLHADGGHYSASSSAELYCVLNLPDHPRSNIDEAFAVDMEVEEGGLHAFKLILSRANRRIMKKCAAPGKRANEWIEDMPHGTMSCILQAHMDSGRLAKISWVHETGLYSQRGVK